jgi:ABC transporter substrate binding protein
MLADLLALGHVPASTLTWQPSVLSICRRNAWLHVAEFSERLERAHSRRHVHFWHNRIFDFLLNAVQRIVMLANEYKLPGVYGFREYAEAGGLISYGLSYRDYFKGVARYVDKVLRGTKPGDLPVEQPTKSNLSLISRRRRTSA